MSNGQFGMGTSDFSSALWSAFLTFLYSQGKIDVPQDFRTRISAIRYMLDSELTGVINTILDYSVNSASQAEFTIECSDDTLKALLNEWLRYVNLEIDGIPTGINEFATEYYKERWKESSFILSRLQSWKSITINNVTIKVPTVIFLVNSASVYVERDRDNYSLGTDKFFLDQAKHKQLPTTGEKIVVQRPYDRIWTEYATPYLIRKGVYRNYKAIEMLQEKTEEVLTKFIPYLFAITKGTADQFAKGVDITDEQLKVLQKGMGQKLEQYKRQKGKTPVWAKTYDIQAEHIIPDLRNILTMELFNQGYRAILSGLGFVDVIQGITSTRKEAVLNPAPFIEEVNSGVEGFKKLLMEIVFQIIKENKIDHRKLFDRNQKFYIANTPLKVNIEPILDNLRQGFIYGAISIKTYQEILGIDPQSERERMEDEQESKDRELFYPHVIQNTEKDPDPIPTIKRSPVSKKEIEKDVEKEKDGVPDKTYKVKGEVEDAKLLETDAYYRNRVEDPSKFQKDSFKTIIFSKEKGIKAIVGKKKNETSLTIQSILFDKEKFTMQEAEKWLKDHDYAEYGSLKEIEDAPYHRLSELPDNVKKLSKDLQELWMRTWNSVYAKDKDEKKAFRISWYQVNQQRNK
jgi:cation transport regulator ChaB